MGRIKADVYGLIMWDCELRCKKNAKSVKNSKK